MTWQAHHDRRDAVFLRSQARDFAGGEPWGVALECHGTQPADGPREGARRIADRHADPPLANVEADNTHGIILSPFSDMTSRTISCVMAVVLSAGLAAQTADRGRTEAEARRVNDRMRALQNEAESLAGQARTLLGRPPKARDRP